MIAWDQATRRCQAPGFVEGVLSGAGGCRLGLAGGGLLADVYGLGLGDGVGVAWWGVVLLMVDRSVHVYGGVGGGCC